jgi:hypothetical protein
MIVKRIVALLPEKCGERAGQHAEKWPAVRRALV